ncbi:uncharacterized protein LOC115552482 [Gadus morhua]|uniref:uncharacterized protein LOC115552482 n=1 Tax=Gadus morhua TaxID=8049 RepID=UPI0011B58D9E|nr:uncharacterized protein LOC115552482 [Gadus morhua]
MELLVLFAACIVIGLSGGENVKVLYGESHRFFLKSRAEYLYFESNDQSSKVPLWTRSKPSDTKRGQYDGYGFFTIEKLTQADNGKYTIQSRFNTTLETNRVDVSHHENLFSKNEGEQLHFEFPMKLKSYTVSYTNADDGDGWVISNEEYKTTRHFDRRMQLRSTQQYTYLVIDDLKAWDSGVFYIQDDQANLAVKVTLEVAAPASTWMNVGLASGVVFIMVSCCFCLKRCCCKKSSKSSEEVTEAADDPPQLQEYSVMPPPPRYHMEPMPPSVSGGPVYSYRPVAPAASAVEVSAFQADPRTANASCSPTSQTVISVPSPPVPFTAPSAEAPATGSQAGTQDSSFGSNFLSSETDPCFEMKGMNLAPPLYSECVTANVYTSDKLNFGFL